MRRKLIPGTRALPTVHTDNEFEDALCRIHVAWGCSEQLAAASGERAAGRGLSQVFIAFSWTRLESCALMAVTTPSERVDCKTLFLSLGAGRRRTIPPTSQRAVW